MALTLTNRETFEVLNWLESDHERLARFRRRAARLAELKHETAILQLSNMLWEELRVDIPDLPGVAGAMMESGLSRVKFYELALWLMLQESPPVVTDVAA
jgi:hypothetical protein